MKQIHYKVILKFMEYGEPCPDCEIQDIIVYENIEEVFQKFPSFQETLAPHKFLVGDMYHGIYLSDIRLTYNDIDKNRPTEEELRNYYIKNNGKSYKNYN